MVDENVKNGPTEKLLSESESTGNIYTTWEILHPPVGGFRMTVSFRVKGKEAAILEKFQSVIQFQIRIAASSLNLQQRTCHPESREGGAKNPPGGSPYLYSKIATFSTHYQTNAMSSYFSRMRDEGSPGWFSNSIKYFLYFTL